MPAQVTYSDTKNCVCKKQQSPVARQRQFPFVISLLIALLPKCPFCIFGYTSVMAMCSGNAVQSHTAGNAAAYLPIILSSFVIVSLFLNFKGQKTVIALGLAVIGTGLTHWSALWSGNLVAYFGGATLIFLSVFMNGSFTFFWQKIKQKIPPLSIFRF